MPDFDMPQAAAGFAVRGRWLIDQLVTEFALSAEQAAAIAGNLGYESAGFAAYHELGQPDGLGGYGWAQWTGPRRHAFFAWCAERELDPRSDAANFGYLVAELRGAQGWVLPRLRQERTLERCVFVFGRWFEAPAGTTADDLPGFEGRLDYARRALAGPQTVPAAS
jgi:Phage tail lysozyme